MKRIVAAAAFLLLASSSVQATPITVLIGGCGTGSPHTGQDVVFVDTNGNACSSATLSGGTITANSTATASATPTAVSAGTGKALNESLFSGLFVELEQAGTLVSSSAPLNVATPNATQVTGTITSTQSVTLTPAAGMSCFGYEISGTWTGVIVPQAQAVSGGSWVTTTALPFATGIAATAFAGNSVGQGNIAGINAIRFTGSSVATGTATVTLLAGPGTCAVMQDNGNFSVNVAQVNGSTVPVGAGTAGASGTQRVVAAQDTTTIAGSAPGTAGTASANVVSVQGVASMTPVQITQTPTTTGGLSVSRLQVANNTTSVAVKASAGQLYGIEAFNNSTTIAYVKLYNAAQGSTTCGSGTPVYQGMIPAPASGGGGYVSMNVQGLAFSTAITVCVTTGFADNDTGAPAASVYAINFFYK